MEWPAVQETIVVTCKSIANCIVRSSTKGPAELVSGIGSCASIYTNSPDPITSITATVLILTALHFILGVVTRNSSWVDKSWSILPAYYTWKIWLTAPGAIIDPRATILAFITAVWCCRLTYNFYRKGGYSWSGEDYRWPIVRAWVKEHLGPVHHIAYIIFDLVFICFIQNVLLASIVAPIYVAVYATPNPAGLNLLDVVAVAVTMGLIITEAIADEQQWNFQNEKYVRLAVASTKPVPAEYYKGFITSGLWRYSRHPNFFCEQSIWWSMSLFAAAATGQLIGWWVVPAAALSALFQGSTKLTEDITAKKYPMYKVYQSRTSRLLPWVPGPTITTDEIVAAAEEWRAQHNNTTKNTTTATATNKASGSRRGARGSKEGAKVVAVEEEKTTTAAGSKDRSRSRSRSATRTTTTGSGAAKGTDSGAKAAATGSTKGRGRRATKKVVPEEEPDTSNDDIDQPIQQKGAGNAAARPRRSIKPKFKATEVEMDVDEIEEELEVRRAAMDVTKPTRRSSRKV